MQAVLHFCEPFYAERFICIGSAALIFVPCMLDPQAGMCGGLGVGRGLLAALSTGGAGSIFGGYTAFMIKSVPEDMAELLTYSRLSAAREAAGGDSSAAAPLRALAQLPDEAADMLLGGTAVSALCSPRGRFESCWIARRVCFCLP